MGRLLLVQNIANVDHLNKTTDSTQWLVAVGSCVGFRAREGLERVHVQAVQWCAGSACERPLWSPFLQALLGPPLPGQSPR